MTAAVHRRLPLASVCLMLVGAACAVSLLYFELYLALWTFAAVWAAVFLFHSYTYRRSDHDGVKVLILPMPLSYVNAAVELLETVLPLRLVRGEPAALLRAAQRRTGLRALADPARTERALAHYCRVMNAPSTPFIGRCVYRRELLDKLCTQLHLAAFKANDALRAQVEAAGRAALHARAPTWIIGMPRSGTSKLFGLLALDPHSRAPAMWQCYKGPLPVDAASCAARRNTIRRDMSLLKGFKDIPHQLGVDMPEEDWLLLQHLWLDYNTPWSEMDESLTRFMLAETTRDERKRIAADYRMLLDACVYEANEQDADLQRRLQKSLASVDKRRAARDDNDNSEKNESGDLEAGTAPHWIFKSIAHTIQFDVLTQAVPRARYVVCHREPGKCCASYASLQHQLRMFRSFESDTAKLGAPPGIDKHPFAHGMDQLLDYRRSLPRDEERARFLDVRFDDIMARPLETVQRIYEHYGLTFTEEYRERIDTYLREQESAGHNHQYSKDEFGVHDDVIKRDFARYLHAHHQHLAPRDEHGNTPAPLPEDKAEARARSKLSDSGRRKYETLVVEDVIEAAIEHANATSEAERPDDVPPATPPASPSDPDFDVSVAATAHSIAVAMSETRKQRKKRRHNKLAQHVVEADDMESCVSHEAAPEVAVAAAQ